MAFASLNVDSPEGKLKWLFSLCDSDRDGLVSEDEAVEVLTILMITGSADPASAQASETEVKQKKNSFETEIKEFSGKIFGEKTLVSDEEFRQRFPETEATFFVGTAQYFSGAVLGSALEDN